MQSIELSDGLILQYSPKYTTRAKVLAEMYNVEYNNMKIKRGPKCDDLDYHYYDQIQNVLEKIRTMKLKVTPVRVSNMLFDEYNIKIGRHSLQTYLKENNNFIYDIYKDGSNQNEETSTACTEAMDGFS